MMKDVWRKIKQAGTNPRVKFLGVFLLAIFLFLETPLRFLSHQFAKILNFCFGEIFLGGEAEIAIQQVLFNAAPIIFLYLPSIVFLWVIARDGYQKLDWIFGPILIAILLKGGIYALICLKENANSFWELIKLGTPEFLIYFFIFLFLGFSLWGLIVWVKNILGEKNE